MKISHFVFLVFVFFTAMQLCVQHLFSFISIFLAPAGMRTTLQYPAFIVVCEKIVEQLYFKFQRFSKTSFTGKCYITIFKIFSFNFIKLVCNLFVDNIVNEVLTRKIRKPIPNVLLYFLVVIEWFYLHKKFKHLSVYFFI